MLSVSVRKITLPKFVFVEDVNSKGEGEGGGGYPKIPQKGCLYGANLPTLIGQSIVSHKPLNIY